MRLVAIKINRAMVHLFARKPVHARNTQGIISFSFDDFPRTAYTNGARIMEKYDLAATFYACLSLMNQTRKSLEHFSADDLRGVVAGGHELACHTYSHLDCCQADPSEISADVEKNARAVNEIFPSYKLESFAFPYGRLTPSAKRVLGPRFSSCRGIRRGINSGRMDLNYLRSNGLHSNQTDWTKIKALIRKNEEIKGWLIFETHDVSESTSQYGCTPEAFESIVACAAESRCQVMTVRAGLRAVSGQ